MKRVLLVDDDEEVLKVNGEFLREKGYRVYTVSSASEVLSAVKVFIPHCIVLDVMMPEEDGYSLITKIREKTDTPVIFLTGRGEESDRIRGLLLGADDYVVKPCSLEELSLRIMVHIKRQEIVHKTQGVMEFPPLRISLLEHKAYYVDEEIALSNREFELLVCLAGHPGEVMEFQQIGMETDGVYIDADRKKIMMTASRLRKRLESYVGLENMIQTVWGRGYYFKGNAND